MSQSTRRPFPPRRDYASLSIRDLLDARDANHVYLSTLPNVVATAIGRYLIHRDDWYATHPPNDPRPEYTGAQTPRPKPPRTLENSFVRPWSWPAVLVFVRDWERPGSLGAQEVPRALYLPDGRVVPTCVVLAPPDESLPPPVPGPSQVSPLLGGGFGCAREHQDTVHTGTIACLVTREGSYYALTNRHVAGIGGERISAYSHGSYHEVGTATDIGKGEIPMSDAFPMWPGGRTQLTIDAGLIRLDDITEWTAQAWGIGEIGELFDATEQTVTLDLIGVPLRAFGGTSGVLEGEIRALFFRYESLGGVDHTTDVLIGPRVPDPGDKREHTVAPSTLRPGKRSRPPFTRPGDSGTLWFYDPPQEGTEHGDVGGHAPPERGVRARRLRPVAMQWGGQRFLGGGGSSSAFALATFLSTITRELDIELVRDWSTGHDEYWGKIGHFAIGWKACGIARGAVGALMRLNQARVGFDDATIGKGAAFKMGRGAYVPLADVPDYVWVSTRGSSEPMQHFADIDIYSITGGPTMLERCVADGSNISAAVWKQFFDGFAAAGVGPEQGTLPFRAWQIWEEMVAYATKKDALRFVAAAGVLAHYVGDASQPLHCSYLHHGVPPLITHAGRKYPIPKLIGGKKNPAYQAFQNSDEAMIHSIYEEGMLEVGAVEALAGVNARLAKRKSNAGSIKNGHDAAKAVIALMDRSRKRLSPKQIIAADDPSLSEPDRRAALWKNKKVRSGTIAALADSVQVLADLWESAWRAGKGTAIPKAQRREFTEAELAAVYRNEKTFLTSLSLTRMASSGRFEPPRAKTRASGRKRRR